MTKNKERQKELKEKIKKLENEVNKLSQVISKKCKETDKLLDKRQSLQEKLNRARMEVRNNFTVLIRFTDTLKEKECDTLKSCYYFINNSIVNRKDTQFIKIEFNHPNEQGE
ncbi:hypothetical protein [Brachyspira sp.]|uniref:hypothetical protein n=1 Tax=Brachyspira sp. TaxID=1977261 RepID=UPI003D7DCA82